MRINRIIKRIIVIMFLACVFSTSFFNLSWEENSVFIQGGNIANGASESYYYDKYTVVPKYNFRVENSASPDKPLGYGYYTSKQVEGYNQYKFNSRTGKFSYDEAFKVLYADDDLTRPIYQDFGSRMCVCTSTSYQNSQKEWRTYYYMLETYLEGEQPGDIIVENLIAPNNTYPENGKHTDGYWYIKKGIVNRNPTITISSPVQNASFSTTLSLKGTVSDADVGDTITTKYNIDGAAEQNISGTITSDGTNKSFANTNISINALSEGTHKLNVWAVDNNGGNSTVQTITFIKDSTPPSVSMPALTANSASQITIQASASDSSGLHATPYFINRNGTDVGTWQTANKYVDTGLSPNTKYTYKYKARDILGNESGYSSTASIYTLANIPTALKVENVSISSITLAWSPNGNPVGTKYELYCNETGTVIYSGIDTTYTHTGRTAGSSYTYKVRAVNGDSIATAYTADLKFRINTQPDALTANNVNMNDVTFTWGSNGNMDGTEYEAYLLKLSDGTLVDIKTVTTNAVSFNKLDSNTRYMVKVRAKISGANFSDYITFSVCTLAKNPTGITITESTNNTLSLSLQKDVSNSTDAEYRVELRPYGGEAIVSTTDWSFETADLTLEGLSENTEYELWVTTRNGDFVENTPVKMLHKVTSNYTPVISVLNTNVTASEIEPNDILTIGGTCYDADNETIIVSATIDGVSKITTINSDTYSESGFADWSLSWKGSELTEGSYTNIVVTATDEKAGVSTEVFTGTLVIDKTGPADIPIIIPSITVPTTENVVVDIGNFGDAAVKEYRIDGGEWLLYSEPIVIWSNCKIEARGLDEYGNQSTSGTIIIANIDKDSPAAPIIKLSDDDWTAASEVTVNIVDGIDAGSGAAKSQIKIGNSEWNDYSSQASISVEGITTVSARTIDNVGHVSKETIAQVRIDRTMPSIDRVYIENGEMYIVGSDNLGLHPNAYKYKLKSTANISNIEAIENTNDSFKLSLLIEADRDLKNQSTSWLGSNKLSGIKLSDKYEIFVRDLAGNIVSVLVNVNKTSGTIYGQLTLEEAAKQASASSNSAAERESFLEKQKREAEKAIANVVTIADQTPVNSQTGQITVDFSNMVSSMSLQSSSLLNCKYRLELTEKDTGALVYSKILTNTSKIVIPDLDDATTYIIKISILDMAGNEINAKSFEQTTQDRTPPIITALKTENNSLIVSAIDNKELSGQAYRYELVSVNINTACSDNKVDLIAISRINEIANNKPWSMDAWTDKSKLENVQANMVIKTIVRDSAGNTTEQIAVVENENREYVNLINAENPYILNTGSTGNISSYLNINGEQIDYSVSDSTIAQIDISGNVTGLKNGEIVVTARNIKTGEIKQLLIKIRRINTLNIRRVIVEKDSITDLKVLYKEQLNNLFGAIEDLEWSINDENIGKISQDGRFDAVNEGIARILITRENKKMIIYAVVAKAGTVKSDIQEINIQAPFVINKGSDIKLDSIVECINFKDKLTEKNEFTVFESSDENIIKISDGNIIALSEGQAEITAIDLVNNVYATIKIDITDITPGNLSFEDVSGHWSEKYFSTQATKSIIRGYSDKQFKPNKKVTNNEFLTMLSKTLLMKQQSHSIKIDRNKMIYAGINKNEAGYNYAASILINIRPIFSSLVFGEHMNTQGSITRGEVAEIIMALTEGKLDRKVNKYYFKDLKDGKHENALKYCIEAGIYSGCGNNKILGEKSLTRAEMLVIMNRLNEILA